MSDDENIGQYERTRIRRAKRLVAEYLSHLESLAKKPPDEAELVRPSVHDLADLYVDLES